jgi:uncharacterized protein with NAD-binding domain and iron-sulfur cluster
VEAGITRIAVLGGGPGAIAAAFELTATPELRARHHVTVYQPGWRLGGKCASGRNAAHHQRIEEHGLHVLFGFYDNAFDIVQRAYIELGRHPDAPLATWEKAFTPCHDLVFLDQYGGRWNKQVLAFPGNELVPGDRDHVHIGEAVRRSIDGVLGLIEAITGLHREDVVPTGDQARHGVIGEVVHFATDQISRLLHRLGDAAEHEVHREVVRLLAAELHRLEGDVDHLLAGSFGNAAKALRAARDLLWKLWVDRHLAENELRFAFTSLDLLGTVVSGIVDDNLLGDGFQKVNGEDFQAFLLRHGAEPFSVDNSPIVRGLYDLTFGFEGGDPTMPNLAAGQSIEALVRIGCLYKGSITYKMMAGMGDTIFGPLYEVLRKRGVEFKMFNWVSKLGVADDDNVVDTIDVIAQVDIGADYQFLVDVGGLPCWPSEPDWDHIVDGDRLRASGVDLEQTANPLNRTPTVLRRGVDFDQVVLGISVGGLKPICADLGERNPRFQAMLDNLTTVGTRAVQVWSGKTTGDLGWSPAVSSISTSYAEPLDTYCDMSHLIPREGFPPGEVNSIGYFCGPLEDTGNHDGDLAAVKTEALEYFSTEVTTLWPKAVEGTSFDWNVLVDDNNGHGPARFDAQYWRANTQGTERYVATRKGTVEYRLRSNESGYRNLVLAGDWTRNGIDGGSVEAAFASGRMASRALCGSPSYVPGEHGPLVDGRGAAEPPTYVEFGGLDTFPGPYDCRNTTLYSFVAMADIGALERLVDRVLTQPTLGAAEFRPLAPMVMLSIGDIANVVPLTPPYNSYGSVNEQQVAVWVPVVQVTGSGATRKAKDFWMFTSYIWVDNPMSMATGREMYGWPKSMGIIHLPDDADQSLSLKTYGLDFGVGNQPSYLQLLAMTPTADSAGESRAGTTVAAFARAVVDGVKAAHNIDLTDGLGIDVDLADDAVDMALPEIYLKQIRSIECGTDAAVQQLCDSHATIETVSFQELPTSYALAIQNISSHPLATDLGIADQEIKVGFKIEMNFRQDVGRVLWDAFDPTVVF